MAPTVRTPPHPTKNLLSRRKLTRRPPSAEAIFSDNKKSS